MHHSTLFTVALFAAVVSVASAIEIPSLTKERILKIQKEHEDSGSGALKFAEPHKVSIDPSNDGDWDPETNTWTLVVESPGATSLNFGFPKFDLPQGATVNIENANPDKAGVKPVKVDSTLKTKDKQLWTPILDTDKIIITVTYEDGEYRKDPPKNDINLGYVNVGFVPIGGDKSGGCNIDVVCPEREGWEKEIASVGGVSFGGSLFCTGSMINSMEQDQTPFFLTATHCGVNNGNAGSLVPYWNYETSTCGGNPDGVLDQFTLGGADFLASTTQFDGTLLRLINDPDPEYKVSFSGWDNTPEAYEVTPGVCIHHPSGDEKRISYEFDAMQTTAYLGNNPNPNQSHVKVIDWDLGTTEPGSSGSPLYNGNNRIIGQLHGGYAACGNNLADWYGRFSKSWEAANWAQWLDPNDVLNGGYGGIDTFDPYSTPTASPVPSSSSVPSMAPTISDAPSNAPTICDGADFKLQLLTDEWASETTWTLTYQDTGEVVLEGGNFQDDTLYTTEECVLGGFCYRFTIFDSYGDGICCGYGEGGYVVTVDGEVVGSGGDFGSSESVDFCTSSDSCVNADTEVPFQGNLYSCDQIVNSNQCSNPIAASHCPLACGECDTYACEDSDAPWSIFGGVYSCGQLAAEDPEDIELYCNEFDLASTCRDTCGFC